MYQTAQVAAISSLGRHIPKLQDPKYVTSLTDQYLLTQQQNAISSSGGTSLTALAVQASGLVV